MGKVLMVQRAECFSPNSVENDYLILKAVANGLEERGHKVEWGSEDDPQLAADSPDCGLILTMGRHEKTLSWLSRLANETGTAVVNSPEGVARCARSLVEQIMEQTGTPKAPADGNDGYWLKRGDAAAQGRDDVVFCADKAELERQTSAMLRRGITSYTVSAHVVGDLVKFYGVTGENFFRCFYPTDDGHSKFGDEQRNGEAQHYAFSQNDLQREAERLAQAVDVSIYGGDAIVRADGTFCLIDFNDWPSFSRCRTEAAEAIVRLAERRLGIRTIE